ncbi:MAG: HAMP domain-containing histidine kinase [Akkermansiaceae bacterium]|nr:HAMP domain-containing histidine kinase [Akkermansiaceae bacterium]
MEPGEVDQKAAFVQQQRAESQVARSSKEYQQDFAWVEKGRRAQVYGEALSKAADASVKPAAINRAKMAAQSAPLNDQLPGAAEVGGAEEPAGPAAKVDMQSGATPFQPVWIGGELFAVREVRHNGRIRYQGLWLKAEELSRHLLASVDDLLPGASLAPIEALAVAALQGASRVDTAALQDDSRALITVPWRLVPGEAAVLPVLAWTPLRLSLAIGWVAVFLALLAAAALVRSVMRMSERRAAFVSSVTHELRTPLTTFQLYSDMLADGMVPSEAKRQEYLGTLRSEAGRLNHLVENVLAYSRIERGSARARHEKVPLSDLLERFRPRLEERAGTEGARLEVENGETCDGMQVDTDVTAVEQIVFNLVDNACKYGMPKEGAGVVRVRALNGGNRARIEVCDEGRGVAHRDRKRLFQPFHKSAKDAAHSKPGVGLGLALCKRLARALGGDLRIDLGRDKGACFVLELPAAKG